MSFQISNYKWENQKQTGDVWGAEWGGDRWQGEILLKQKQIFVHEDIFMPFIIMKGREMDTHFMILGKSAVSLGCILNVHFGTRLEYEKDNLPQWFAWESPGSYLLFEHNYELSPVILKNVLSCSMVLAQGQGNRSMEQNRKPKDKSTHLWTSYLWQRRQEYTMEKRQSL